MILLFVSLERLPEDYSTWKPRRALVGHSTASMRASTNSSQLNYPNIPPRETAVAAHMGFT